MSRLMRRRSFAVIGLGGFGSTVALELERLGNEVLGIDRDEEKVRAVADRLSHAIVADARDEGALSEAGLADYAVTMVAIGEDLESSILCTMTLKTMGARCVWVKAVNRIHARILQRIGADNIIEPEHEMGLHVAARLAMPIILDYIRLGSGHYVVNIDVPEELDGRAVSTLKIGREFDLRFLGVMRGPRYLSGEGEDLVLRKRDHLILMGSREELQRLGDHL